MIRDSSTYIIAEAGVNHNGSLETALRMVEAASDAGVNAVKFQTFTASEVVRRGTPKAEYQRKNDGVSEDQYEMLARLELSREAHFIILKHCARYGVDFLSTPFDQGSLRFLVDGLGLKTIKIGSGEITNAPMLLDAARMGVDVILSTGMSTIGEVEEALSYLAFGYLASREKPCREALVEAYASDEGQEVLRSRVTLLHCTTEYPAPPESVNLRAMVTMRRAFGLRVGYSDHTDGVGISLAAVAMGASVLEKHFTLDRSMPGPDHMASLEPMGLAELVRSVRSVELAIGEAVKIPSRFEWANRRLARKSIVAGSTIRKGETFKEENLAFKRPGTGQPPSELWRLLHRPSIKSYLEGDIIED